MYILTINGGKKTYSLWFPEFSEEQNNALWGKKGSCVCWLSFANYLFSLLVHTHIKMYIFWFVIFYCLHLDMVPWQAIISCYFTAIYYHSFVFKLFLIFKLSKKFSKVHEVDKFELCFICLYQVLNVEVGLLDKVC